MMRGRGAIAGVAWAVAALILPATVFANGRPPKTMSLSLPPEKDPAILLPTTFGLLISKDGGKSFRWVCEKTLHYDGIYDPDFAIAADGTIYATSYDGLLASHDGACTFELARGFLAGQWVDMVEIGSDGAIWAATAEGGMPNDVYVSKNNGKSFATVGLHTDVGWFKSVKVAPGDPLRVYVSGYQVSGTDPPSDPAALLYRSVNGGTAWETLPVTDFSFEGVPQLYVLGASPTDADVVFAQVPLKGDVYRSADGGQTWAKVVTLGEKITAFVVRGDGKTVIAGTVNQGVQISGDAGLTWEAPTQQPQMSCVGESADQSTLYSCGNNWEPDVFALATSTDGQTWSGIFRFSAIAGPLSCPAGTVQHDICEVVQWPMQCMQLGATCPPQADEPPPVPVDAAPGPDGDDDSCAGCSATGGSLAALVLILPVLPWRRRKRNDGNDDHAKKR